jgi:hypothetical protein
MRWGSWRAIATVCVLVPGAAWAQPVAPIRPTDLPPAAPVVIPPSPPKFLPPGSSVPPSEPKFLPPNSPARLPAVIPPVEAPLKDLTPPGFATDVPAVHPVYHEVPGHLRPAAPQEGGPFASAEFLLLRARRSAFDFAMIGDPTGLVPVGPIRSLNYDLQGGFRGELGHRFGGSNWEAFFAYTYYHSSAFDSLLAPGSQVLFPTLTKPGLTNTATFASAQASLDYNTYDLLLGKRFVVDNHLALRLFGGIRFASIQQDFDAFYEGIDARSAAVNVNSKFQGVGPLFGGEAVWAGWKGFHLYARGSGGLLTGQSDNPYIESNSAGNTLYASTANDIRKVVPVASVGIGAGWQYRSVSLRVGYEITNYFGVIDQPRFTDDVGLGKLTTRSSDLSLEGLFFQLGLAF